MLFLTNFYIIITYYYFIKFLRKIHSTENLKSIAKIQPRYKTSIKSNNLGQTTTILFKSSAKQIFS